MEPTKTETQYFFERTRSAFLWTRLLNIPFWAIFNTLVIILYKDLHATPLQITVLVALKPVAALFSPYWSTLINKRPDRLVANLIWANILKFLPFLFFPWIHNNWVFVLSFGFFMIFARGVIPAWMEIIKRNIGGTARERTFAFGSLVDYIGSAILPLGFGWILDDYDQSWRWIFFATAFIGIVSTLFLYRIPITHSIKAESEPRVQFGWSQIVKPWRESWELLKSRPDFARFQIGFMFGGAGLMIYQTTLPYFYVDVLDLSYTKILLAITVCKAIGYAVSTPAWVRAFDKVNIFTFCSVVTLTAAVFPLLLLSSVSFIGFLYLAYIIFGVMQAGSELGWHMSGPTFAKEEDSSVFSGTNVLTVGIRGCIAPALGTLIYMSTNSIVVMLTASFLCLIACERMRHYAKNTQAFKPEVA